MTKKSNTQGTLTLDEAAQRYGFTVHYLRRQVEKGVLVACQQWLTTTSAVERFIGNNAQPTDGKDKEQTLRHLLASRLRILRGTR
ncbi:MAG: hypothetical protein HY308_00315, partial [Gammaproteobacteria bacterium]|nr:hypothetical protein [Gammaproteobacteria bacterium]